MRTAFVSLRLVNFRYLWYSQIASFTGMQMQQVARGLLAYQLTGSYASTGIVMLSWGIPQTLFSLVGGAVADRVNRRNVIILVQFGTGGLSLLTAVLIVVGVISIPILFVMGLCQGTLFAFNMPARQAYLAELVPHSELMNAIALNNMAMNATRVIGPMFAAVLIASWGVEAAYFAQSFLYLFVIYYLFRLPPSTGHLRSGEARRSVLADIGLGLRYVRNAPTLRLLILMAFVPTILGMPYMTLLPGFAVDELNRGAGSYGLMFTVTGIGAIVGSFAIAALSGYPRKPLMQVMTGLGWGASLLALGLVSKQFGYAGALISLGALGLFSTTYQTLNNTMVMTATDAAYYGRVMSIYMLTFSVFPLAAYPMGVVADQITATTTFALLGAGIVAFVFVLFALNTRYSLSDERKLGPPAAPGAITAG
ncbi:MAG: MFS transporter [Dehalococcoidia bacterium]